MFQMARYEIPLFERMQKEEYVEVHRNRELIESLQQRLEDLDKINMDLEHRLGKGFYYTQHPYYRFV